MPLGRKIWWRSKTKRLQLWAEALDQGRSKLVDHRDAVCQYQHPLTDIHFSSPSIDFPGITWGNDKVAVLITGGIPEILNISFLIHLIIAKKQRIVSIEIPKML
jgi:hypothetical protein